MFVGCAACRGLAPEIVHFVMSPDADEGAAEERKQYAPEDWYIKGSKCVRARSDVVVCVRVC